MYARPKRFIKPKIMLMKSKMKTILVLMFQQIHYVFGQLSFQTKKKKSYRMYSEFLKEDCPKISDIWLCSSLLYLWWAGSINKTTSSKFFNPLRFLGRNLFGVGSQEVVILFDQSLWTSKFAKIMRLRMMMLENVHG